VKKEIPHKPFVLGLVLPPPTAGIDAADARLMASRQKGDLDG
jgi:hypothetical protein